MLDDVHWSDPGSLEFLRTWARSLRDNQILGVVSYRSDELTRRHPLDQLLPLLVREARARRLTVAPLDNQAVGALISTRFPLEASDVDRLVAWLMERSEGNPFFLAELVQTLEEQRSLVPLTDGHWRVGDLAQVRVPVLVRQVIEGRLDRLQDELASCSRLGQFLDRMSRSICGTR